MLCAAGLSGCRNNGPLSDPFLRTRVPPPGTGAANAAAVDPYTGAPSGIPVTPSATIPGATPGAQPPPFQVPPKDRFSPAGGFNYQQGSNETKARAGSILASGQPATTNGSPESPSNDVDKLMALGAPRKTPAKTIARTSTSRTAAKPADLLGPTTSGIPQHGNDELAAALSAAPDLGATGATFRRPPAPINPSITLDSNNGLTASMLITRPRATGTPEQVSSPLDEEISTKRYAAKASQSASMERPIRLTAASSKNSLRIVGASTEQPAREYASAVALASAEVSENDPALVMPAVASVAETAPARVAGPALGGNEWQPAMAAKESLAKENIPARPTPTALAPVAETDYAHAPGYDWLQGKLEFSPSNRQWKLRYIPVDGQTDQYGGSVLLGQVELKGAQAGDVVLAQGAIDQKQRGSGYAPRYQLSQLQRVAR